MRTDKLDLLQHAMQAYQWRLQALTTNIANLDTPGYQRLSVSFEEMLQDARHNVPSLRDVTGVRARMNVEDGPSILEDEMMGLADTQMRHQMTARAVREHFGLMRMGITGHTG